MLTVERVDTSDGFIGLRDQWDQLSSRSEATVFQTWEWCWSWWQSYAKGRRLFIICAKEEGRLVGLAPLFISSYFGLPLKVARFLGTGCSDYGGCLVERGLESKALAAIFSHLEEDRGWDALDLHQLPHGAPELSTPGLRGQASATPLRQDECLTLSLPSRYEDFLKTLSKKFRWNIGYYRRRLEREGKIGFYRTSSPEKVADDMEDFFRLHQKRFISKRKLGRFLSPRFVRFHSNLAAEMLRAGRLALYFLEVGGARVAALYGFEFGGAFYYYLAGFDPSWGHLSVSTVLLSMVIEDCINRGLVKFDFLRGAEPYKLRWGAVPSANSRLILERPTQRSSFARRLIQAENALVVKAKARSAEI